MKGGVIFKKGGVEAWNESQKMGCVTQLKTKKGLFGHKQNIWKYQKEVTDDYNETGSLIQIILYQIESN